MNIPENYSVKIRYSFLKKYKRVNTASGNNYNQAAYQAAQQNSVWNRTMQGLNTAANVARAVSSFTPAGASSNIGGN